MNNKILSILIISIIMFGVTPSTASPLDSLGTQINHYGGVIIDSLNPASLVLPSVGTINVQCESGANCNLAGDNFNVEMLVTSSASKPNIQLTLQPGIDRISTDGTEWKTQGAVIVSLLDKGATLNIPTAFINVPCVDTWAKCRDLDFNFFLWDSWGLAGTPYQISAYRPTQFSNVVTTHYDISVDSPTGNLGNIPVNYNYLSPQHATFTDNQGNNAVISPMYQTNQGINAEVSGRIFVSNGFGTYYLFDENAFTTANNQAWDEQMSCSNYLGDNPCALNYADWYQKILKHTSPLTMANSAKISTKTGNEMIISYPAGAIGTKVQAVISKKMAQSIQVIQSYGIPRIDSVTSTTAIKGSTKATVTVKATNTNTGGSDNFQVTLNSASNGFNVQKISSPIGNILYGDATQGIKQGTWIFSIDPTGITQSNCVNMVATAISSGGSDTKSFQTCVTIPNPTDPKQNIFITAYNIDGTSVLSNAPIIVGGNQVGIGQKTYQGIVGQTYVISTNNISNPSLFAPSAQQVTLMAGAPATVSLYFKTTPQTDAPDYTWVFWLVIIIIIGALGYFTGWYRLPVFWYGLIALFLLYQIYLVIIGVSDYITNWSPW